MKRFRIAAVVVGTVVLAGCVNDGPPPQGFAPPTDYVPMDQISIQQHFDIVAVNRDNVASEAIRCVPTLVPGSKTMRDLEAKMPLRVGQVTMVLHMSSASVFFIAPEGATCIRQSANHHPILAADAFANTANPTSVPPSITNGWYEQIARGIAEKGNVTVAYVMTNGSAQIVNYWVQSKTDLTLRYSNEFKKAGTWESGTYDFRFAHPTLTAFTVTRRGVNAGAGSPNGASVKIDLLADR